MGALVCDDHPLVRSALKLVVEGLAGAPVYVAGNFVEAWSVAENERDLNLGVVDLQMPGMCAMEGLSGLRERAPDMKLVVLTGSDSDDDLLAALAIGIDGFVHKSVEPGVVEAALRLVLAGGRYLPARVAELAAAHQPNGAASRPVTAQPVEAPFGRLSARQRDVLDQMARGRPNKEIARLLGLSPATVKTHVAHIIAAMGALNRTEAVTRAREQGLV